MKGRRLNSGSNSRPIIGSDFGANITSQYRPAIIIDASIDHWSTIDIQHCELRPIIGPIILSYMGLYLSSRTRIYLCITVKSRNLTSLLFKNIYFFPEKTCAIYSRNRKYSFYDRRKLFRFFSVLMSGCLLRMKGAGFGKEYGVYDSLPVLLNDDARGTYGSRWLVPANNAKPLR